MGHKVRREKQRNIQTTLTFYNSYKNDSVISDIYYYINTVLWKRQQYILYISDLKKKINSSLGL